MYSMISRKAPRAFLKMNQCYFRHHPRRFQANACAVSEDNIKLRPVRVLGMGIVPLPEDNRLYQELKIRQVAMSNFASGSGTDTIVIDKNGYIIHICPYSTKKTLYLGEFHNDNVDLYMVEDVKTMFHPNEVEDS